MRPSPSSSSVSPAFAAPAVSSLFVCLMGLAALFVLAVMPRQALAWEWSWGGKNVSASGTLKTETRSVNGFSGIALSLPANVVLKQSGKESLSIATDEAYLPYIETVIERGTLKIRSSERNVNFRGKAKMDIVIEVAAIESLSISGSGDIHSEQLQSPKLKASIAGSGNVDIKSLTGDSLKVSIAGSGDFRAGGAVDELEGSIAGSGDIRAGQLKAKAAKLSIAGSGDATVWAVDTLKMSVAGSGDVKYYGDPKLSTSVVGSGSAKRLGAAPTN